MQDEFYVCKNCKQSINSKDLLTHFKKCQQQIKTDQENKQMQIEQQKKVLECQDLYGDSDQPEKINITVKKPQITCNNQTENSKIIYQQCIYCQQNFQQEEIENHYDSCEAAQFLISQHIGEQEPVAQKVVDNENDEEVEEEVLNGGVIKRTIINTDERTGYTHYRTYFKYPNYNNQEQLERNEDGQNRKSPLVEIIYQPSSQLSEENTQCCICYEKYQKNQKLTLLDCMHRFHKKCIYIWLEKKNTCPICKFEVNDQF